MTLQAKPQADCRGCGKPFLRFRTTQAACSPRCALKSVRADKKAEADETRARRLAIKPRSKWLREAQAAFNYYIRMRDAALPCVSCSKATGNHWDAGHYLTRGARPELRFNEANCHKQCIACNQHLHGNLILYRVELIKRIGLEAVEGLEGPHPAMHWSVDDLRTIKHTYRAKARELQGCMDRALSSIKTPPPTVTITKTHPNWKTGEQGEFRVDVLFDSSPPKPTEEPQ